MEGIWCTGVELPDEPPPSYQDTLKGKQSLLPPQEPEYDEKIRNLPEHERPVLHRQLYTPAVKLGFFGLYQYATTIDLVILAFSTVCAILGGAIFPLMTIVFGSLVGTFSDFELGHASAQQFRQSIAHLALYFIYLAVAEFVTIYICIVGFIYVGAHVTQKIREQYLAAILRQNISFFDALGAGEVTTRITTDTNLVQEAISEKVSLTISQLSTFLTAFVIAYIYFWKLGLISTATIVFMIGCVYFVRGYVGKYARRSILAYGQGGTIAEEVIRSIRVVAAFGVQDTFAKRYDVQLGFAEMWGVRVKIAISLSVASVMGAIMLNYGLNFWMGSRFLIDGEITLGKIIIIIYAIVTGAMSLGSIAPYLQAFVTGLASASKIFATIARESPLDPSSGDGETLDHVEWEGSIDFNNVKHIYPSRPDSVVLKDLSLHFEAGKTTALVGSSGSGKSSIINLFMRFSQPVSGDILLDGLDIKYLNLRWLRRQIALVSQEPTLFSTTIYENIKFGLVGSTYEHSSEEVQRRKVLDAAFMANAHEFIMNLPDGYDSDVGESGGTLSGGQRQRIAIARAIASDPKILLLDEATSALDTRSEEAVHRALDAAAKGRTTIVIAHRLSTIKNADRIIVMDKGQVLEQGTHQELLEGGGPYWKLVQAQQLQEEYKQGNKDKGVRDDEFVDDIYEVPMTPKTPVLQHRFSGYASSAATLGTEASISRSSYMSRDALLSPPLPAEETLLPTPEQPERSPSLWTLIKLVAHYNKPEWMLLGLGLIFSVVAGGAAPTQAVFFSKSIISLSAPPSQYLEIPRQISFWALMYLMLGLVQILAYCTHGWAFAKASECLIHRVRDQAFRTILRQDISFFDQDENSVGALTSFLGQQTINLAGFSGATLGTFLSAITTIFAACIVSISLGWKLGLVCTATVPALIGCGFLRTYMLARFQAESRSATETSAAYACEATSAIHTVAALTMEEHVYQHYHNQLETQVMDSLKQNLRSSSLYAASQSMAFLCLALGFWYGGVLVSRHEYSLFEFFLCFTEITVSAQSAGNVFSAAPDLGKARDAAKNLKKIFDRKPEIDIWSTAGQRLEKMQGRIEFRNVRFGYRTRKQLALKGLDMTIVPGQYVAIVGASGCGKSTLLSLLERFYNPTSGHILVDDQDISTLNLNDYRSHLALVSQQPALYQGSIYENVALGACRGQFVSEKDVVQACQDANIYDFIPSLPDGLQTAVGNKGGMLSGGQKQRIAIARALLRKPKILLLDEATSALDSESEKIVQDALDAAAKGRTTIAVAHRLSTIQGADQIYVLDDGELAEHGTHDQLLQRRGKYYELARLQNLGA